VVARKGNEGLEPESWRIKKRTVSVRKFGEHISSTV
jgi:hypothetical protein